jgi:hypothetical protein
MATRNKATYDDRPPVAPFLVPATATSEKRPKKCTAPSGVKRERRTRSASAYGLRFLFRQPLLLGFEELL